MSEKKIKGWRFFSLSVDRANLEQCSGSSPCATCLTENRQCLYAPARDRRLKAYTAELSNFRVALSRMAAKLRSGAPEEISLLVQEIRNLPTDQDAVNYLVHKC